MNVLIDDERASHQFAVAESTFERVVAEHPKHIHKTSFMFGGQLVHIRIVGPELAKHILLPFFHLQTHVTTKAEPQLTIDLWDENETNIRREPDSTIGGREWYAYTEMSPQDRFFTQRSPNTFTCLDRKANRIIGSMAWSDQVFIYERAKPLARVLLEWHNDQKIQVIHGGMVSRNGRGVLFVGKSGSGKSTAALASACAGMDFLAEDYVALERQPDKKFFGHSMYNSVFLEKNHLERFPSLKAFALPSSQPNEKKAGFILAEVFPDRLERVASISHLIVVRVGNTAQAHLSPASKAETLLALGPSSLFQIPSRGKNAFTQLSELTDCVPTHCLQIGEDLPSIRPCIERLLECNVGH